MITAITKMNGNLLGPILFFKKIRKNTGIFLPHTNSKNGGHICPKGRLCPEGILCPDDNHSSCARAKKPLVLSKGIFTRVICHPGQYYPSGTLCPMSTFNVVVGHKMPSGQNWPAGLICPLRFVLETWDFFARVLNLKYLQSHWFFNQVIPWMVIRKVQVKMWIF